MGCKEHIRQKDVKEWRKLQQQQQKAALLFMAMRTIAFHSGREKKNLPFFQLSSPLRIACNTDFVFTFVKTKW